ncbi:MAG: hypothetical protein KC457_26105 [Myxococcales bacterium]|nr:hypothetical protein [Myxococcales bacterium]
MPPLGPDYEGGSVEIVAPEAPPKPGPAPEPDIPAPEPQPTEDLEPAPTEDLEPAPRDRLGCTVVSCRRMAIAGISVGALSLTALGVGIGLRARPNQLIRTAPSTIRSTHPVGVLLITVSSAVVITSGLMLAAAYQGDPGRGRKRRSARIEPIPGGFRF